MNEVYTEIAVPLDKWRAIDKTGWNELIKSWNRRMGHMKKVPQASVMVSSAFLPPQDRRNEEKRRKKERRKDLFKAPQLTWTEVPQKLPYRKEGDTIYVEKTFTDMVKKERARNRKQ